MNSQKNAVVLMVKHILPGFRSYHDIALAMLSKEQLEQLKIHIGQCIMGGTIEYSKSLIESEVMAYARSMVMNHLKKARELNGNQVYGKTQAMVESSKSSKKLSVINLDSLPDDLRAYVKTIV